MAVKEEIKMAMPKIATPAAPIRPAHEHSVPFLWPLAPMVEIEENGLQLFQENLKYLSEAEEITAPPAPVWATANRVLIDLDTMRLRDFSPKPNNAIPVIIDAPYAGHTSVIADFAHGQSLVETMLGAGLERVLVTDWKSASEEMKYFDIDKYLAEINVAVDELGGAVHLVGLCQGGWMSAMYAARFPKKVRSLVLAGSPIDTDAGSGPIKEMAHSLPLNVYEEMVAAGDGRMLGRTMLAGWKNMHPQANYLGKYIDLFAHVDDPTYLQRTEQFERWYENPIDLPGRYYLQAINDLFKENHFARGEFVGLGHKLNLKNVTCPLYLLAGDRDDITTREQVFAAENLVGTPREQIKKQLVPGGHIGLFMGRHTLADVWPGISQWIGAQGA